MTAGELQRTPLYDEHLRLDGRMVEFGGWEMPVQYSGVKEEHQAVREQAGLFDVSHMGEIEVTGDDALGFIDQLVTNNCQRLEPGRALYTVMCDPSGGVIDDLLVYDLSGLEQPSLYDLPQEPLYWLVVNAANTAGDFAWVEQQAAAFDGAVQVRDRSHEIFQLALQGPLAQEILQPLVDTDLELIRFFRFHTGVDLAGANVLISRTGYTGEDGFEIYGASSQAVTAWTAILQAGENRGLMPAGLGARDTLRFEACLPLYGQELDRDHNPLEAGLGFCVKLDKGAFTGRQPLKKAKDAGLQQHLVGFKLIDRGVPRHGYELYRDGSRCGQVTSGNYAPTLDGYYGLGYVTAPKPEPGDRLEVDIRGRKREAEVVSTPFYRRG